MSAVHHLGFDFVCGASRRTTVQQGRSAKLKAKVARVLGIERRGGNAYRSARTGFNSGRASGVYITGMAEAPLQTWRASIGKLLPGQGRGGSTTLKYMLVDSASDPIFPATLGPVMAYAEAYWDQGCKPVSLRRPSEE